MSQRKARGKPQAKGTPSPRQSPGALPTGPVIGIDSPPLDAETVRIPSTLLLLVDIQGFSERPVAEQLLLLDKLSSILDTLVSRYKHDPVTISNSTGDGALIAFSPQATEQDVLLLGLEAIRQMQQRVVCPKGQCDGAGLRVAVHRGAFSRRFNRVTGVYEAIGTGPNDLSRLIAYADAGDIVFSESACSHWEHEDGSQASSSTTQRFSKTVLAYVKHGRAIRFRVYIGEDSPRHGQMPSRVAHLHRIDTEIMRCLGRIGANFEEFLRDGMAISDQASWLVDVSARISLFVYVKQRESGGTLMPSVYRFHRHDINPATGSTSYVVNDGTASPQARAYRLQKACAVNCVPSYQSDPAAYRAFLLEKGFSNREISDFSRKAGAFVCFPLVGPESSFQIETFCRGIVCIDTHSSLCAFSEESLASIGDSLQQAWGGILNILVSQRIPH